MNLFFKALFSFTVCLSVLLSAVSSSAQNLHPDYKYPYTNPYLATLTAALAKTTDSFSVEEISFVVKPARQNIPILPNRNTVHFYMAAHKQDAPLVFILPGLGGTADSGLTLYLAELIFKNGYNVVTIDDPFSWQFAINASSNGLVGYGPQDAKDLYEELKVFKKTLDARKISTNSVGLIGYSLGGLDAAYLLQVDNEEKVFNFKRVISVNPPINIEHGAEALDSFLAEGWKLRPDTRNYIMVKVQDFGLAQLDKPLDSNYFLNLDKTFVYSDSIKKFLIGADFKQSLTEIIFASQMVHNYGVLKSHVTWAYRQDLYKEISKYGFIRYLNDFVFPKLLNIDPKSQPEAAQKALFESGLEGLKDFVHNDSRLYIMHNADDFLLRKDDVNWITSVYGDRAYIYPHGGHMGNFWYKDNQKDMLSILSALK